ncbi:MAG TPA: N-acetyltransferase family protein [Trichormus sp.]|jgi:phosphinothricin acetyltransferase
MAQKQTSIVPVVVREAKPSDVVTIHTIYNQYVKASAATFAMVPETLADRQSWYESHVKSNMPVFVASVDGKAIGWSSISTYNSRCAYSQSAEVSVYLEPGQLGKGYGSLLLDAAVAQSAKRDIHCLVAQVCTENTASVALFKSRQFREVGILREIGRKFDRWLDVMLLQRLLGTETS